MNSDFWFLIFTTEYEWVMSFIVFVIQSEAKNLEDTAQPKVDAPEILHYTPFRSGWQLLKNLKYSVELGALHGEFN